MSSTGDLWLSSLVVALFGVLLFLRVRYPNASRGSEILVLASATVLFFSICDHFLSPDERSTQTVEQLSEVDPR